MTFIVKICGLTDETALDAALSAGADLVGIMQFARSPRHVDVERGAELAERARGEAGIVLVTVDMPSAELDHAVALIRPDWVQCHGQETPERVARIAAQTGCRTIKVISVADSADLDSAEAYAGACDMFLLDARAPAGATRPGGLGRTFDWSLLDGRTLAEPFLISGGLTPDNVAEAAAVEASVGVDVSSGVERAPGRKDPTLIASFVRAARAAADQRSAQPIGAAL